MKTRDLRRTCAIFALSIVSALLLTSCSEEGNPLEQPAETNVFDEADVLSDDLLPFLPSTFDFLVVVRPRGLPPSHPGMTSGRVPFELPLGVEEAVRENDWVLAVTSGREFDLYEEATGESPGWKGGLVLQASESIHSIEQAFVRDLPRIQPVGKLNVFALRTQADQGYSGPCAALLCESCVGFYTSRDELVSVMEAGGLSRQLLKNRGFDFTTLPDAEIPMVMFRDFGPEKSGPDSEILQGHGREGVPSRTRVLIFWMESSENYEFGGWTECSGVDSVQLWMETTFKKSFERDAQNDGGTASTLPEHSISFFRTDDDPGGLRFHGKFPEGALEVLARAAVIMAICGTNPQW